jgi:hypothetical protein
MLAQKNFIWDKNTQNKGVFLSPVPKSATTLQVQM